MVKTNGIYRVTEVGVICDMGYLCFEGITNETENHYGHNIHVFRKIKPDTEPCEEDFTTLIKRGNKVQA